jgi:disulfide bond formation protein DsbB
MARAPLPPLTFWPAAAAAVSAAMLVTAHTFQHFGFEPCALCLRQREVYWAALAVGLVGFAVARGPYRRVAALALGALFVTGLAVAVYHSGAEWKFWPGPATCGASISGVSAQAMSDLLGGATVRPPACDEASWRMLGLSMAGWNALVSAGLAGLSFLIAFGAERRR